MRIDAVVSARTGNADAIRAYAERLVDALNAHGEESRLTLLGRRASPTDVLLVQYNPFSYGRWGFAPGVVLWALRQRWTRSAGMLTFMVHEPYVAAVDVRSCLMATWQRPQLVLLCLLAHRVLAPSAEQARRCGGRIRHPRVVPVGSNLPDARASRAASRRAIGIGAEDIVLVSFAASSAGRLQELVSSASMGVLDRGHSCVLLVLGLSNLPPHSVPKTVRVICTGYLEDAAAAACLAAGDIFLAPYVDGVSTRRGTLIAALQHGMPVVGTVTSQSDPVLAESEAIVGVAVDADDDFRRATGDLASSSDDRIRRGAAARALFEREFAWERIVSRLMDQLA